MRFFTILLLLSFIGIAVFGFTTMAREENGHRGCIAAMAKGIDCFENAGAFAFVKFHLDAFKNFSSATFGGYFLMALLLLASLVVIITLAFLIVTYIKQSFFLLCQWRGKNFESFIRWLALHENSPAIL